MARSISNWERLSHFAARERIAIQCLRNEIAAALGAFLERNIADVAAGKRVAGINCGLDHLLAFATQQVSKGGGGAISSLKTVGLSTRLTAGLQSALAIRHDGTHRSGNAQIA